MEKMNFSSAQYKSKVFWKISQSGSVKGNGNARTDRQTDGRMGGRTDRLWPLKMISHAILMAVKYTNTIAGVYGVVTENTMRRRITPEDHNNMSAKSADIKQVIMNKAFHLSCIIYMIDSDWPTWDHTVTYYHPTSDNFRNCTKIIFPYGFQLEIQLDYE